MFGDNIFNGKRERLIGFADELEKRRLPIHFWFQSPQIRSSGMKTSSQRLKARTIHDLNGCGDTLKYSAFKL